MYFLLNLLYNFLILCNAEIYLKPLKTLSFKIQANRQKPGCGAEVFADILSNLFTSMNNQTADKYFLSVQQFTPSETTINKLNSMYPFLRLLYINTKSANFLLLCDITPTLKLVRHEIKRHPNVSDKNEFILESIFEDISINKHPINVIYLNTKLMFQIFEVEPTQFEHLYYQINNLLKAAKVPRIVVATGFFSISLVQLKDSLNGIDEKFPWRICLLKTYIHQYTEIAHDLILVAVSVPDPYTLEFKNNLCSIGRFDRIDMLNMYVELEYKIKINRTKSTTASTTSKTTKEISTVIKTTTNNLTEVTTDTGIIKPSFVMVTNELKNSDPIIYISTTENISKMPKFEFSLKKHHKIIFAIIVLILAFFIIKTIVKRNQ